MGRRQQLHLDAETTQPKCPMVSEAATFHDHQIDTAIGQPALTRLLTGPLRGDPKTLRQNVWALSTGSPPLRGLFDQVTYFSQRSEDDFARNFTWQL